MAPTPLLCPFISAGLSSSHGLATLLSQNHSCTPWHRDTPNCFTAAEIRHSKKLRSSILHPKLWHGLQLWTLPWSVAPWQSDGEPRPIWDPGPIYPDLAKIGKGIMVTLRVVPICEAKTFLGSIAFTLRHVDHQTLHVPQCRKHSATTSSTSAVVLPVPRVLTSTSSTYY